MNGRFYTISELAKGLCVPKSAIKALIRSRRIKSTNKCGRILIFDQSQYDAAQTVIDIRRAEESARKIVVSVPAAPKVDLSKEFERLEADIQKRKEAQNTAAVYVTEQLKEIAFGLREVGPALQMESDFFRAELSTVKLWLTQLANELGVVLKEPEKEGAYRFAPFGDPRKPEEVR